MILAERHEKVVYHQPVALGKLLPQRKLGLLRRFGLHVPPAVADPVHMGIDADPGFSESEGDHEIGRLAPHSLEFEKFIYFIRHFAPIIVEESTADAQNG